MAHSIAVANPEKLSTPVSEALEAIVRVRTQHLVNQADGGPLTEPRPMSEERARNIARMFYLTMDLSNWRLNQLLIFAELLWNDETIPGDVADGSFWSNRPIANEAEQLIPLVRGLALDPDEAFEIHGGSK